MTVSSTTAKISYAGNDSNTSFSFAFTVYVNTDLVVTFTNSSGVESTLTEGAGTSNYSVSVSSYPGTGSITWPASGSTKLQSNEKITIKRVLPLTQTIDLQNQGGYFPDVQEQGFDRGVYLSQQIDEEVDRSIKIPVSSATSIDSTLPAPTAGTVIGAWNDDADAIVAGPTVANISAAEANATAAAASAVTAAAEASAANPKYTFSTSTGMTDPGAGTLRYNHGTVASVSAIALDDTTADTGNPDIEAWLKSWDDSTSTVKGWLRLVEPGTPANYAVFHITGLTDSSGFIQLAVTHIDSNGTFGNGDSIRVMFSRTGDKGDTGSTGSQGIQGDEAGVLPYVFATSTTDSDPTAGKLRFNHGTLSSISQIFIDDQSNASGNPDVSALLLTWDDSTNVSDKGTIVVSKKSALQNYFIGKLTSLVDASGYVKLVVTHVASNGSFSADDDLLVEFQRTGNAGSLSDPMTTRGDIIVRDSSNATARLAVGAASTVLVGGTDPSYAQVATAMIADDAITLAKMAPGTDGNLITYDSSGNPAAVATGSAGQILTSAGAGSPPVFAAAAGGWAHVETKTADNSEMTFSHTVASGYDYQFVFRNCNIGGDASAHYPFLQIGTGAGPTFQTSGYLNQSLMADDSTVTGQRDVRTDGIEILASMGTVGGDHDTRFMSGQMLVYDPGAATKAVTEGRMFADDASVIPHLCINNGRYDTATAVTAFRFTSAAYHFEPGTVSLYRKAIA